MFAHAIQYGKQKTGKSFVNIIIFSFFLSVFIFIWDHMIFQTSSTDMKFFSGPAKINSQAVSESDPVLNDPSKYK